MLENEMSRRLRALEALLYLIPLLTNQERVLLVKAINTGACLMA